jgi:hypothetical protein
MIVWQDHRRTGGVVAREDGGTQADIERSILGGIGSRCR